MRTVRVLAVSTAALCGLALSGGGAASAADPSEMTPIGGGYALDTLQGFARAAAHGASGPTVDLVVVPELERTLALLLAKRVRLVDLGVLW